MKDYKIKEQLCNMGQSIGTLKEKVDELTGKFDVLVEILTEKERDKENDL